MLRAPFGRPPDPFAGPGRRRNFSVGCADSTPVILIATCANPQQSSSIRPASSLVHAAALSHWCGITSESADSSPPRPLPRASSCSTWPRLRSFVATARSATRELKSSADRLSASSPSRHPGGDRHRPAGAGYPRRGPRGRRRGARRATAHRFRGPVLKPRRLFSSTAGGALIAVELSGGGGCWAIRFSGHERLRPAERRAAEL